MSTDESNATPPENTPPSAETGIKRDWVAMPKTADPSVRFNRIEEQLELSAGIQVSSVEKMFSAFEAIENLAETVLANQDMFTKLIEQMDKDRDENARRFDKLYDLVERKLKDQKANPDTIEESGK